MVMDKTERQKMYGQRRRRIYTVTIISCILLAITAFAWDYGPAYIAYRNYTPREGDILFQSLPRTHIVNAIEGACRSPYSHCGIVAKQDDKWVVYEALHKVRATPLQKFLFRGRKHGFAAHRLKPDCQQYIPATIENVRKYLGRPYDSHYRMDDDFIYCSELIHKAYRDASGGKQLGKIVRLDELDWQPYVDLIQQFEQGLVPLDREVITPKHLAEDKQLEFVHAYQIGGASDYSTP